MVAQTDGEIYLRPSEPVGKPINEEVFQDGQRMEIQVLNSNDFVVGKQTNFNGPVTIIACPTLEDDPSERVVIRDQIWTTATTKALNLEADKKSQNKDLPQSNRPPDKTANQKLPAVLFSIEGVRHLAFQPYLGIPYFIWFLIILVILTGLVAAVAHLTTASESIRQEQTREFIGDSSHLYFTKRDWGGLNASSKLYINQPTPYVLISHTAGGFCYETDTCQSLIRNIQKDHMGRQPPFADIAFNFMIGGDGYIYEGRGWGVRSPHEGFVNNHNIDINLIGDFSVYDDPTIAQLDAVKKLLIFGVENCHLDANYTLMAHSALVPTLSPGKNVVKVISTWDHYDPDPKSHVDRYRDGPTQNCSSPVPFGAMLNESNADQSTDLTPAAVLLTDNANST